MAIVVYKCTVCNREVDLIERPDGLEKINRCVVTNECRGTLYKVDRKPTYAVGRFPADVAGVTNYIQRKVLYNHEQSIADSEWLVVHNLGVNPSMQVVVDRDEIVDGEVVAARIEVEPASITIIDENTVSIQFERAESGLAQAIARSAAPDPLHAQRKMAPAEETIYFPLSNDGYLTIGTEDSTPGTVQVRIYFVRNDELTEDALAVADYIDYDAVAPAHANSPWSDAEELFVNGKRYTVRSIEIGDPISMLGIPNGTTVAFEQTSSASPQPPLANQIVVLLGRAPYSNVDKIKNRVFRPGWLEGPAKTLDSFVFANNQFVADTNVIETMFPPIHIID